MTIMNRLTKMSIQKLILNYIQIARIVYRILMNNFGLKKLFF